MNFLAHTLFAQGNAERIVGQFCGDFVRGSDLSQYSEGIQQGIRRHRRVDAQTDKHPSVKACHDVFKPPVRRFAGIITDVVFDHFIAREWSRFSTVPIEQHVESVHAALNDNRAILPEGLKRFSDFMQQENILLGNLEYAGVELTLQRLSRRSPRFTPMAQGAAIALEHEAVILSAFNDFFPELLAEELAA